MRHNLLGSMDLSNRVKTRARTRIGYTHRPRNINLVPIDYSFALIQEINEIAAGPGLICDARVRATGPGFALGPFLCVESKGGKSNGNYFHLIYAGHSGGVVRKRNNFVIQIFFFRPRLTPPNGLRGSHCRGPAVETLSCGCKMAVPLAGVTAGQR